GRGTTTGAGVRRRGPPDGGTSAATPDRPRPPRRTGRRVARRTATRRPVHRRSPPRRTPNECTNVRRAVVRGWAFVVEGGRHEREHLPRHRGYRDEHRVVGGRRQTRRRNG